MNTPVVRQRITRRALHGVLLLDKPLGLSSNDALQKAKWLLRAEKAGHTGTLDPLATGLLPLCFGAATKFSQVSLDADKAYEAVLMLGVTTTTGDAEGEVLERRDVAVSRAQIDAALAQFTGLIDQVPPMYSALKFEGRPLYEYARAGITIDRPSRQITIHSIDVLDWRAEQPDRLTIAVRCTKGTYIRTLAEDIGRVLGCGASLAIPNGFQMNEQLEDIAVERRRRFGARHRERYLLDLHSLTLHGQPPACPTLRSPPG